MNSMAVAMTTMSSAMTAATAKVKTKHKEKIDAENEEKAND